MSMMNTSTKVSPLERGDLKILILNQLKTPMHSYQIIASFRDKSDGRYKPSSGALYPQLQALEKKGLVKDKEESGKRVYSLTKKGETYLLQNKKVVKDTTNRFNEYAEDGDLKDVELVTGRMEQIWSNGVNTYMKGKDPKGSIKIKKSKSLFRKTEKELKEIWS